MPVRISCEFLFLDILYSVDFVKAVVKYFDDLSDAVRDGWSTQRVEDGISKQAISENG